MELKPYWRRLFGFNWKFGLLLILAVCIPRFLMVLKANETADYSAIGFIMAVSALSPFVFLSKFGRRSIGMTKPSKYGWLIIAFVSGMALSTLLHLLGQALYGDSDSNWYYYIGKSYNIPPGIAGNDKAVLFVVMALTGMTFSPIGEELFFRGIVHGSFATSLGVRNASLVDSTAFALTHIAHFGLVFSGNGWKFLTIPALLWVVGMFLASLLFVACKQRSGSIVGAIVCHAGFNLGMIYLIFYWMG